jgi:peptidoglycan/LPS O-acetylase OafA/YrhL
MFGIFRVFLAIAVVMNHTMPSLQGIGAVAVFCFFLLSGFLMTLLMTGVYVDRPADFFLNRFLRLYPMYWGAFIITLLLWATIAPPPGFPRTTSMVLQAVYLVNGPDRVVSPAWAVTNEICCYLLIGLGVTRTRMYATWTLIASIAVTVSIYLSSYRTLSDLYFPVAGAFLPFALGGFLAHQVQRMRPASHLSNLSLLAFGAVGILVCMKAESVAFLAGLRVTPMHILYFSLLPASAAVVALYRINAAPRFRSLDDFVGRFSYPIYLLHESMGWIAAAFFLPGFVGTLSVTVAMSAVFLVLIDNPVNRIRSVVRGRTLPKPDRGNREIGKPPLVTSAAP